MSEFDWGLDEEIKDSKEKKKNRENTPGDGYNLFRFGVVRGASTEFTILSAKPTLRWEVQFSFRGNNYNFETIPHIKQGDQPSKPGYKDGEIPFTQYLKPRKYPYRCFDLVVIDHTKGKSKAGKEYKDTVKLMSIREFDKLDKYFVQSMDLQIEEDEDLKYNLMEVLRAIFEKKGSLRGCKFVAKRGKGDRTPKYGSQWTLVKVETDEELEKNFKAAVDLEKTINLETLNPPKTRKEIMSLYFSGVESGGTTPEEAPEIKDEEVPPEDSEEDIGY